MMKHMSQSAVSRFDPASVTRPDPALLTYYIIVSIFTVFGFPFVFPVLYFKFRTLKYKFDDKGVSMAWGILNHREIYLTYRRIQDIHVTRNLMHRWLGLASVSVQTASGSSGAEMTIEGIRDPEALRDFLYAQMRGAKGEGDDAVTASPAAQSDQAQPEDEALQLLREIRDELRARHNVAGQGA
jgi:uncharacterized protein